MILVTGATGNVGRELVSALLARGEAVRAVVRDPGQTALPARVDVVRGDLDIAQSLAPALTGVRGVFLLGSLGDLPGLLPHIGRAGVDQVVLLSSRCVVGGKPDNAITRMWLHTEAAVRESGTAWTVLRPSGFASNALRWLPQLRRGDVVRAPWPDVPIAAIDPADVAAVAAAVLTEPGHEGIAHSLSGPEPLLPADQVRILSDVLRRPLAYAPVSDDDARADMTADWPAPVVDAFFRFFTDGEFDDAPVLDTVREVTGHPPRHFEQWVRTHADTFASPR